MDASIILQGQPVNALAAITAGNQAGFNAYGMRRQQGMDQMMQAQGPGILAGNQNALNALAGYDPAAALSIQGQQQDMAMQRERMAMDREQFQMQKEAAKQAAAAKLAEQAAQINAAELAASRDQMAKGLAGASFFYQQGDRAGYEGFLRAQGLDPAQFPFDDFPAYAAQFEGVIEAMEAFAPPAAPSVNDRFKVVGNQIFDLTAEGGPRMVAEAPGQTETVFGPDGQPIIQRGPAKPFTEAQSKDNVYATRAAGALEKLEMPADPNNPAAGTVADQLASLSDNLANRVPILGNYMTGQGFQVAETAGQEFLQAILRKDTGAAITADEQALYGETYLPRPGDTPERLAYKREARARALAAIQAGMSEAQLAAKAQADAAVLATMGGGAPAAAPAPTGGPQPGTVEDGYRFKGGDPADPNNWERL